jgi:hypothetical protein
VRRRVAPLRERVPQVDAADAHAFETGRPDLFAHAADLAFFAFLR